MEFINLIIVFIGFFLLGWGVATILIRRAAQRDRARAEIRREWSQARPNWQGHEGWGGRE